MTKKSKIIFGIGILIALIGLAFYYGSQPATSEDDYKDQAASYAFDRYLLGYVEEGEVVKVKGEVFNFEDAVEPGDIFILFTDDGEFYVKNNTEGMIREGEVITVYGGYVGNEENTPAITGNFIER